jgi:hypothetical protein
MGDWTMTKGENAEKLPGSKLHQFAEKYFEPPGLERIALPIIADLQREYSSKPHTSSTRFFILLRGYLGFWKSIVLYSLFSAEGNIRVFKSVSFLRLLGAAVGAIGALLIWKGNRTPGLVSLFPNLLTALAVLCLLCLAVWFCVRQLRTRGFPDIWRVSGKISVPVGIILWMIQWLLLHKLWALPLPPDAFNLILTLIVALVVVLVYRTVASSIVWCVFTVTKSMKAV